MNTFDMVTNTVWDKGDLVSVEGTDLDGCPCAQKEATKK